MNEKTTDTAAGAGPLNAECQQASVNYSSPPRPLRSISLIEQRDADRRVSWTMIEGSDTAFGLDEPNLIHTLTKQLYDLPNRAQGTVKDISFRAFEHGMGTGRQIGASDERSRAARARVDAAAEQDAADETKRAARRAARKAPTKKTPAKPRKRTR